MADNEDTSPLTTGQWFVTMLIMAIPLVGLIMLFVWAFGGGNIGRRNYCRAALIWAVIFIVLGIGIAVLGGGLAAMAGAASQG